MPLFEAQVSSSEAQVHLSEAQVHPSAMKVEIHTYVAKQNLHTILLQKFYIQIFLKM